MPIISNIEKTGAAANGSPAPVGFDTNLWAAADALRNPMNAAEGTYVVLGLIFLKYISGALEAHHAALEVQRHRGADPEHQDEYRAANIFWMQYVSRWQHLTASAPPPTTGALVDDAMTEIERGNLPLRGVLPKVYAPPASTSSGSAGSSTS